MIMEIAVIEDIHVEIFIEYDQIEEILRVKNEEK